MQHFQYRTKALLIGITLLLTACVSVPQGTSLNDPAISSRHSNQSVWVKSASITDSQSRIADIAEADKSLTATLAAYLRDSKRFDTVGLFPGKVRVGDQLLAFSFSTYRMERQPHPAYFPVAILTATLYIWFNGPIYNDKSEISGTLQIYDINENLLTTFTKNYENKQSVGLWSGNYSSPDGATPRTAVVSDLLDQYQNYLEQHSGQKQ